MISTSNSEELNWVEFTAWAVIGFGTWAPVSTGWVGSGRGAGGRRRSSLVAFAKNNFQKSEEVKRVEEDLKQSKPDNTEKVTETNQEYEYEYYYDRK